MENSKFQFKGFTIVRSLIERKSEKGSQKLTLKFSPRGLINKGQNTFQLQLGVKIEDIDKTFNIEIDAIANYIFEDTECMDNLGIYFYTNAPALLFPYIRAYIATLTNLSGFEPINLPTLNMTQLGAELEKNVSEI